MANLVTAAVLLVLLCASTLSWALVQTRSIASGPPVRDMLQARLWLAAMSLALMAVIIIAAAMALFIPGETGLERMIAAITSPAILVGLVACAIASLYPMYLCARVWRAENGRGSEKLHLALHLGAMYAVVVVLLELGTAAG